MLKDRYGNFVSTASHAALAKFDEACELIRLYRGDPIGALDAALAEDPDFTMAWAARAGVLAQQTDTDYADEIERSLRAASVTGGTERERAHLAAARDLMEGRFHAGTMRFARIAQENPKDLIALQAAHVCCFFLGRAAELRDFPVQALRAFAPGDDGYHAVLSMAAFGHEENGEYDRAEALGKEAVRAEPRDAWAAHAVAHVHEMKGDTRNGIAWLTDTAPGWSPENGFAYHNWWHLALLHIERGDAAEALKLYDTKVRPAESPVILEWVDASALLWRLRLEGVDAGNRWNALADHWQRAAEQGYYAFNDLHALMAFLGAGRSSDVERTLSAMRRASSGEGDNAYMTRAVGLPLAEAFVAFERGRYAEAVDGIARVRGIAQRFGGSHAQRDILGLTLFHAALRAGHRGVAEAIAAERVTRKPESPWARALARRAADMALEQRAA